MTWNNSETEGFVLSEVTITWFCVILILTKSQSMILCMSNSNINILDLLDTHVKLFHSVSKMRGLDYTSVHVSACVFPYFIWLQYTPSHIWMEIHFPSYLFWYLFVKLQGCTLPEINIHIPFLKALLKMMLLFPRWGMLVPWRLSICLHWPIATLSFWQQSTIG